MKSGSRKALSRLVIAAAAFAALSCTDRSATTAPKVIAPGNASRNISDGAHGGNDDVWFLPPMLASPVGKPGYGDPFAPGLPVVIKVVDVTPNPHKVLVGVTATTMSLADQWYQANWDTKNTTDNNPITDSYEVQVWIGSLEVAWADANLVSSGSALKTTSGDFVNLLDGRTLPIKVRIEQGWNCQNNSTCVSQVVPANIPPGTTVTVTTNDGKDFLILHGDGTGAWNTGGVPAIVTIEDISGQVTPPNTPLGCAQAITRMVVDGHCIKITTDPAIILVTNAVVCMTLQSFQTDWKLLKYNFNETTKFLDDPPANVCPGGSPTIGSASRSSNPILRLASRVGHALRDLVTPRLAYAFDLGVGGTISSGDGFSFFAAGLPAQIVKVAGDNQTALPGSILPIAPQVQILTTHHHSVPVGGAMVTCTVTAGGGSIAAAGLATEAPTGTYTCPSWTLGAAAGTNTLNVTANILDPGLAGGTATFTETGQTGCITGCPNPILAFKSAQAVVIGGIAGTEYNLTVTNRSQYSDQLFAATQGVVCGLNTSAARMWADIYDANGDVFLNSFCALGTSANLDAIYFVVTAGTTPPANVYLLLTDQVTHTVYRSNTVSLGNPTITSLTANPASAVIGGGLSNYTVSISNPGGQIPAGGAITGVTDGTNDAVDVQAWIIQGNLKVAADGTVTLCSGQPIGLLPSGTCTFTTSFGAAGTGGLSAGPATLSIDLERQTGGTHTIYDTKTLAITLTSPAP